MRTVDVTPVCSTAPYADNDVLFVPISVSAYSDAFETAVPSQELVSLSVLDEADQAQAMDLVFTQGDVTLGTINDAVSISDADARNVIGVISVSTSDYVDLVNSQIAVKTDLSLILNPSTGLYISGILRSGTPTYAADSLRIKLGFED